MITANRLKNISLLSILALSAGLSLTGCSNSGPNTGSSVDDSDPNAEAVESTQTTSYYTIRTGSDDNPDRILDKLTIEGSTIRIWDTRADCKDGFEAFVEQPHYEATLAANNTRVIYPGSIYYGTNSKPSILITDRIVEFSGASWVALTDDQAIEMLKAEGC